MFCSLIYRLAASMTNMNVRCHGMHMQLEDLSASSEPDDLKSIASALILFSSLQNTYAELEALKVCTLSAQSVLSPLAHGAFCVLAALRHLATAFLSPCVEFCRECVLL